MKRFILAAGLRGVAHGHQSVAKSFIQAAAAGAVSHHEAEVSAEKASSPADVPAAQPATAPDLPKQSHDH